MLSDRWRQVEAEAIRLSRQDLRSLARQEDRRHLVWRAPHVEADLLKQPLDAAAMAALGAFADARALKDAIGRLFSGEIVNATESRPALHWALRAREDGGDERRAAILRERDRLAAFARMARGGGLGFDIRTVLHIGIGGSDLGPRLVHDALGANENGIDLRFCANIDPDDFRSAVSGADPATTLVIVVSKSFKTPETAANAEMARAWLALSLKSDEVERRLAAVTSAPERARLWGAASERIFPMDEAVGGRFSVWSAVGLSLQIVLGGDAWAAFLAGACEMDEHFATAPLEDNLPAKLAMTDVFLHTAMGIESRTVLAYAHRLRRLPDYLQQLEMESNGKSAPLTPGGLVGPTSPVVWGAAGTLGQHSFHQLLHQGMRRSAIEFVVRLDAGGDNPAYGRRLIANAFAQAEALLEGREEDGVTRAIEAAGAPAAASQARHMAMPGGRGSTMLLLDTLSPRSLGALLALYEHRTFAAGVLWGVNPFDQWGVERGKTLAEEIEAAILGADPGPRDLSTLRLISRLRSV